MTIIKHELRQGKIAFLVWTFSIGLLLMACVFMFPEMKGEMNSMGKVFSAMGLFTEAFGLDKLNFGTMIGFYAIECGNIVGLGGAFFAALLGISMLAKEEKDRTAEFLLTHPISRKCILTGKLAAFLIQIFAMNLIALALAVASIAMVGERVAVSDLLMLHAAYTLMQIEIAAICFGISAFSRRGNMGIGMGIAIIAYFINLLANMSKKAKILKYFTPFGYCDGADIISNHKMDTGMIALAIVVSAVGIVVAYLQYQKKDIQ